MLIMIEAAVKDRDRPGENGIGTEAGLEEINAT
jgi:hypothetical protein